MSFRINRNGLKGLLKGEPIVVSDGVHPTYTHVYFDDDVLAYLKQRLPEQPEVKQCDGCLCHGWGKKEHCEVCEPSTERKEEKRRALEEFFDVKLPKEHEEAQPKPKCECNEPQIWGEHCAETCICPCHAKCDSPGCEKAKRLVGDRHIPLDCPCACHGDDPGSSIHVFSGPKRIDFDDITPRVQPDVTPYKDKQGRTLASGNAIPEKCSNCEHLWNSLEKACDTSNHWTTKYFEAIKPREDEREWRIAVKNLVKSWPTPGYWSSVEKAEWMQGVDRSLERFL